MSITIEEYVNSGSYADVYRGTDEFGRAVAIKLIRPSNANETFIRQQASALARAEHPNIVKVYKVERVIDPRTKLQVDAIILEWVPGASLTEYLKAGQHPVEDVRTIGLSIISAIKHMHASGIVHDDLHTDNVLVNGTTVKIIDALYYDSLAQLSTTSREVRYNGDLFSAKMILRRLLGCCPGGARMVDRFDATLPVNANLEDLDSCFRSISDDVDQLHTILRQLAAPSFVDTDQYAEALVTMTPSELAVPLLISITNQNSMQPKYTAFVRSLFTRCSDTDRQSVADVLAARFDLCDPQTEWEPHLCMLGATGGDMWNRLPRTVRIKVESIIVESVKAGEHDAYSSSPLPRFGKVGLAVAQLGVFFADRDLLIRTIAAKLRSSQWAEQNYVGEHLLGMLPSLADTLQRRAELIDALRAAREADAKRVMRNLGKLPEDWQQEVRQ